MPNVEWSGFQASILLLFRLAGGYIGAFHECSDTIVAEGP
jgi:hypothetical protein